MIKEIEKFRVKVYKKKARWSVESELIGEATVVGAYFRPFWHPYVHSAYHVIYDDGTKDTVFADHCKVIES